MSGEALSITIQPGTAQLLWLYDGSLNLSFPLGDLSDYGELSKQFISLGVSLMYRGRELHGDLRDSSVEEVG